MQHEECVKKPGLGRFAFPKSKPTLKTRNPPTNHMNDLTPLYGQAIRISQELEQRRARAPELMPCADLADQLVVELGRLWADSARHPR